MTKGRTQAEAYREILENRWWNPDSSFYQTFWTEDQKFYRGEGVPFILWFDASENPDRIRASVKDILSREWNVENMSAFPTLFIVWGMMTRLIIFGKSASHEQV